MPGAANGDYHNHSSLPQGVFWFSGGTSTAWFCCFRPDTGTNGGDCRLNGLCIPTAPAGNTRLDSPTGAAADERHFPNQRLHSSPAMNTVQSPRNENSRPAVAAGRAMRSRRRRLFRFALSAIVVFAVADFIHSRCVAFLVSDWESRQQRDANGVLAGCDSFELGSGPEAVLLIHGINDSPAVWRRMAVPLAGAGRMVSALRLPGFALPPEKYRDATVAEWLAGVDAEVRRLSAGHGRVHVVCHSLGAAVFLRWLQDHPGSVASLTLLSPAIEVGSSRSPLLPVRWWHRISGLLLFTRTVWSPFSNDVRDPDVATESTRTPFTPRQVIDRTFELVDANRGFAPRIDVPLMMVLSRNDRVIDWEAANGFYDQLRCEPRRRIFNDRSGHVIPVDFGWQEIAEAIIGFQDQTGRGREPP